MINYRINVTGAYWGAGLLFVLGNIFYGSSYVFYASYLPKLARNTPSVREEKDPIERAKKLTLQTSNLSLSGFTAGYVGGLIQMGLSIGKCQMSQTCKLLYLSNFSYINIKRCFVRHELFFQRLDDRLCHWRNMVGSLHYNSAHFYYPA